MSTTPLRDQALIIAPTQQSRSWLRRLLSPPNPFYLLSAAFILHSTGLGISGAGELPATVIVGIVGGYVLLLSTIGFGIVRLWNVWDDARSILLIVMLLFLEMALAADRPLVEHSVLGVRLLLIGLTITILATEIILRGLRMRLPFAFRGPLYLLWSLLFLYPLIMLDPLAHREYALMPWLTLGFPVACGCGILTLLPAVRRGPSSVGESGTPWEWPWYPGTLFVFLGLCLLARSAAICVSFDPAFALDFNAAWNFQSVWGPYFTVPILLAFAVLLMEAAIARRHWATHLAALFLPALCVGLSIPGSEGNAAYREFVIQLVENVGSPLWLMLLAAGGLYAVAAVRGLALAWRGVVFCVLALGAVTPETIDLRQITHAEPWPLLVAAGMLMLPGVIQHRSRWVLEGSLYAIGAVWAYDWLDGQVISEMRLVATLAMTATLLVGGLMRDAAAQSIRRLGSTTMVVAAGEMCLQTSVLHAVRWLPVAYLFYMALLPAVIGGWCRDPFVRSSGAINGVKWYTGTLLQVSVLLREWYAWAGWRSFLWGIAMLHVAVAASAIKGGVHRRMLSVLLPSRVVGGRSSC